jgi:transmembrane sensor
MSFFHSGRRVRREAALWVARLGGGTGEQDHVAFRAWYEADRRNAEAYDRMAAIWSASGQLPKAAPEARGAAAPGRRDFVYAVAASILAIAAIAFMLRGGMSGAGSEPPVSYATSRGELREVALPDGSRVVLDAGSRIELAFSAAERRLFLREGRARFSVAHEARPFIVQAGQDQVVATGTVFDVSLLDHRLSVVLLEGTVEIRRSRGPTAPSVRRLTAGHRLVLQGQGEPATTPMARGDTSWASRMLEFDDIALGQVVEMANRYSSTQIRVEDEAVRGLRVTGAYRAGDAAGLARGLAAAFGLRLSTDPDGNLRLSRGAPAR